MSLFQCISLNENVLRTPAQFVILNVWCSLFFLEFVCQKCLWYAQFYIAKLLPVRQDTYSVKELRCRMLILRCPFFTAVTCPSIETLLSEHVVWRLISGSLNEYGAQVMLSCSPGYYLLGRRLIQCRTNGTWSVGNERPSCKGKEHTCLQNILCFLIHIFCFINRLKFWAFLKILLSIFYR